METVVIGSGVLGLTAHCVTEDDCPVTDFEQGRGIGGVTATLQLDGFGCDPGPPLLEGLARGEPIDSLLGGPA